MEEFRMGDINLDSDQQSQYTQIRTQQNLSDQKHKMTIKYKEKVLLHFIFCHRSFGCFKPQPG